jgi:dephospho-CoA kinase
VSGPAKAKKIAVLAVHILILYKPAISGKIVLMIVGITGTLGAGKGTVVEYLIIKKGFKHYSMSGFIAEEVALRGLPVNRDTLTEVGNNLREKNGPGFLSDQLLSRAAAKGGDAVIESLRSVGEVENLKKHGAPIWAVDADIHTRYERVTRRKSEKDSVSFEKFVADEERESHHEEPWLMNLPRCIEMADHVFTNNGTQEELFAQVEAALKVD